MRDGEILGAAKNIVEKSLGGSDLNKGVD